MKGADGHILFHPCVGAGVTPRAEFGSWGTSLLDMLTTWDASLALSGEFFTTEEARK